MRTVAANDAFRWLAALGFLCSPLLTAIAPRWTAIFFPLLVFALLIAAMWHTVPWRELLKPSAALFGCLALSLYVFVNASWASNPDAGFAKATLLLGLIVVLFGLNAIIAALIQRQRRAFAFAFAIGAFLGALYLVADVLTDGAITRFAFNTLPVIRPDNTKRLIVADGDVQHINLSILNQSVTIVMLSLWPAIMILAGLASRPVRALLIVVFFAVTVAAVFASRHDSSQIALLGSTMVLVFAWAWPRFAIRGLAVLWCLAFVLVLPASFLARDANLQAHAALPKSYKARIILWEYTAEKTLERPWLGVGVNSTREMDETRRSARDNADRIQNRKRRGGAAFPRTTGHHGHNLFLQTWHELGAVGAALLALAGALVLLRAETLPRNLQPYAAAGFTVFALIGAFAWGMWQTWWICAVGLMAIYLSLGRQFRAPRPPPSLGADA